MTTGRGPTHRMTVIWEAVARTGSQSMAARDLGVSQAVVSGAVLRYMALTGLDGPAPGVRTRESGSLPRGRGKVGAMRAELARLVEQRDGLDAELTTAQLEIARLSDLLGALSAEADRFTAMAIRLDRLEALIVRGGTGASDRRIVDGGMGRRHQLHHARKD